MRDPVAIVISNYNMPERVDALVEHFERTTRWPTDLIVADNASERMPPSRHTTLSWSENVGPAGVWPVALAYARRLARKRGRPHLGYLVCATSTYVPESEAERDLVTPLAEHLEAERRAVFVHPAYTPDTKSAFRDMFDRGSGRARQVGFCETLCGLIRADWFDAGGGFDPDFVLHWGIDVDLCLRARRDRRSVWVHEGVRVRKQPDEGYDLGRFEMSAAERVRRAQADMDAILSRKWRKPAHDLMVELGALPSPRRTRRRRRRPLRALRKAGWELRARLRR